MEVVLREIPVVKEVLRGNFAEETSGEDLVLAMKLGEGLGVVG